MVPPAASKKKEKKVRESEEKFSLLELKTLGQQLLSSRSHINNLPRLLKFVDPSSPPQYALESLLSLQSFFTPLLPQLPSSDAAKLPQKASASDAKLIYRTWLRSKFDDFLRSLINLAVSSQCEQNLREVVLEAIMEFVKIGNAGKFHSAVYHRLLHSIVHSALRVEDILLQLLALKYFKYIDVCYFTLISLDKMARNLEAEVRSCTDGKNPSLESDNGYLSRASMELSTQKIYVLLSNIPPLEDSSRKLNYEMWNGSGIFIGKASIKGCGKISDGEDRKQNAEVPDDKDMSTKLTKKMKLKFSKAWISFLRLPLPLDVYKEVLIILHQSVIPYLSNPVMLCDFLTRSYDIGGVVSVMALSSLFILMTQHSLEYPKFYEKLYALLEPSIFMAKYRARFFQLVDSCLKSPLLPAYLAASFCKRLSRLALSVPPSGTLIIIALVHNLLRRHPSINFLVHQDVNDTFDEASGLEKGDVERAIDTCSGKDTSIYKAGIYHFDYEQSDPMKTNAMRSSLWEIDTLRHHYCPPVSRFVLSLENDLTVRAKTTEVAVKDFSSGSYATIFGEEIKRRVKQVPLAIFKATPTSLFSETDFPGWTFKFGNGELITVNEDIGKETAVSTKRQRTE